MNHSPLLLVILDGWGHRAQADHNVILHKAPYFGELLGRYPHTLLSASGEEVGLPLGLMGNSEVGHMNLGAGRTVWQDVSRIDKSIRDGEFERNGTIVQAMERVRESGGTLHLLGLVSDGGVHASDYHLRTLLQMAHDRGLAPDRVAVHAMLDGRDTPPRSGAGYLDALEADIKRAGVGRIVSVIGRYWAMDRDTRWERVQRAYDLFTAGAGDKHPTAAAAIAASYANDVGDEFVEPCVIGDGSGRMADGDVLFCFNYRSDRMREIVSALGLADFHGFERRTVPKLEICTMTQYHAEYPFALAFPAVEIRGTFAEVISNAGLRQMRVAETEKYAHVTFFFSGGREVEVPGESRELVPSPKVATYDLKPEMSAFEVKDRLLAAIERDETDVYIVNFANADMVGHTGIEAAAEVAVAAVDQCLLEIVAAVRKRGGLTVITADHGNAEQMWDSKNDQPHTAHTTNPVPIVLCSDELIGAALRPMGVLADVVPTLCELTGIPTSPGMDGRSLLG